MTDFRINVIVDPTQAQSGSRRVKSELQGINNVATGLQRTLTRVFAILGGGALITRGIGLLADYEQTMSTVRAITGATELQMRDLRTEAERLGATTRFSASQAGEGLIFLSRAGFTADESLKVLAPTLQLAQAGGLGLGRAADIATNVLSGFRLEVDQASRFVDVLALTANSANTDVEQLGQALSFVAPVAAGLGIELEETAAAIGVLSDAGLQSSRAGTGLRRVLSSLESPTKEVRDILASYGVTVDQVRPSTVGLTEALQVLKDAGVDTGAALELFGDRGGPAFEVLAAGLPRVRELTGELNNAGGTAERVAAIMDDNLNGALLATRSALEAVVLALGNAGATGALTGFFGLMAEGLRNIAGNIDTFIDVIEALGTALAINLAARAIPAAITAIRALGIAIISNPLGAFATALTAATAAFVGFSDRISLGADNAGTALDFLISLGEIVGSVFVEAFGKVVSFFSGAQTEVDEFDFTDFVRGAGQAVDNVIAFFRAGFFALLNETNNFVAKVDAAFAGIANFFPGVEVERKARDSGLTAGEAFSKAYGVYVQRGPVSGLVETALEKAGERGAARAARKAAEELEDGIKGVTGTAGDTGDDTGSGTGRLAPGSADRNSILQQTLRDLDREADVLRAVGDERLTLQGILKVEDQIRQKLRESNSELTEEQLNNLSTLSEAERSQIEELIRRNAQLDRQGAILNGILGPAQDYKDTQAALNSLVEQGIINQNQYNAALQQTGLIQSLGALDQQLFGNFGAGAEFQIEQTRAIEQQRLDIVQQALDARIISEEAAAEKIRQINKQTNAEIFAINTNGFKQIADQGESSFGALAGFIKQYGDDTSNVFKGLFATQQAFALASAVVNTAQGVSLALATSPPPLNFVNAALVAAAGAAEVATIAAQTAQGFADGGIVNAQGGGFISGPGSSRSDEIPARLSNGEFVVNARATRQNRQTLEAINRGQNPETSTGPISVQFNLPPNADAESFKRSERQISFRMQQLMAELAERNNARRS